MTDPNKDLSRQVAAMGGITQQQFDELSAQFPPPYPGAEANACQVSWLLGVQAVLLKLRKYVR